MIIGYRIRTLREAKNLSQGDIEKRCGLLRAYISRVEHGHTVPSLETLEKFARALEVPLYQLFYEGGGPPDLPRLPKRKTAEEIAGGNPGREASFWKKLRAVLTRLSERDRRLFVQVIRKMARR